MKNGALSVHHRDRVAKDVWEKDRWIDELVKQVLGVLMRGRWKRTLVSEK